MSLLHALAIDVKTTGLDPTRDAVVELAAAGIGIDPATGQYDAPQTLFTSLVDPHRDIPATAVHFLTARDVQGQPDLAQALAGLQAAVAHFQPAVLIAHGALVEAGFLPRIAGELTPDDPRWVCTQRLAEHLWPRAKYGFGLMALRYVAGPPDHITSPNLHRAACSAASCAVLLTVQCRILTEAGYTVTPALLRDWSAAVPLLARVPSGRSLPPSLSNPCPS